MVPNNHLNGGIRYEEGSRKKVEVNLEALLGYCQEKAEFVKDQSDVIDRIISRFAEHIERYGIKKADEAYNRAKEDYDRSYSQLLGMLELAQFLYDPEKKVGYFTLTFDEKFKVKKVIFKEFET